MIMIHFRDPDPSNPYPDPHSARFRDEDYKLVMKEIESLAQHWEQVWAYLEDDNDPCDWVMIFMNWED